MDERLPPGSTATATLRMLLEKERERTGVVEQEVARLQAGLARQNTLLLDLQLRDAARAQERRELQTLMAGLTEQNTLLRQRVATLEQENAHLRGVPLAPAPAPPPEVKPAAPQREPKVRKKRAAEHNHGRRRAEQVTHRVDHAVDACPRCGTALHDGWFVRKVQVIDLPPPAPLLVTEHRMIRRECPCCGLHVMPKPVGLEAGRIGRSRFGPRLLAAIATMRSTERLPIAAIQERLRREYGLTISRGGICGLLQRMAAAAQPAYEQLQADARAGPTTHADETGWRENGQRTTVWTVSTTAVVVFHHGRRTSEEIDGILGADFSGTLVTDCYAAYDHFEGAKQRCWAHFVREVQAFLHEHGTNHDTVAWAEGILAVYEQASAVRPPAEEGATPEAARARRERAQRCEALILLLCPAEPDPSLPYATFAKRLRTHLGELFTFVRDPLVPSTNNAAERSLRPLVIARKISGGTRSAAGSTTRMVLFSISATARLQGKEPTAIYEQLLLAPPSTPSPLAVHPSLP